MANFRPQFLPTLCLYLDIDSCIYFSKSSWFCLYGSVMSVGVGKLTNWWKLNQIFRENTKPFFFKISVKLPTAASAVNYSSSDHNIKDNSYNFTNLVFSNVNLHRSRDIKLGGIWVPTLAHQIAIVLISILKFYWTIAIWCAKVGTQIPPNFTPLLRFLICNVSAIEHFYFECDEI